jgi:hypothetical protein
MSLRQEVNPFLSTIKYWLLLVICTAFPVWPGTSCGFPWTVNLMVVVVCRTWCTMVWNPAFILRKMFWLMICHYILIISANQLITLNAGFQTIVHQVLQTTTTIKFTVHGNPQCHVCEEVLTTKWILPPW